ncbi:MAG: 4Fe-4S binding protein [Candidatus Riflebacteria bacterium]|nr:4Fe-4S binding protein [Candidatus Riflebacteria bacterium]
MKMKYFGNLITTSISEKNCTGCGFCLNVCPRKVLALSEGKARLVDPDSCIECGACAKNCPFQAISLVSGVGCANAILRGLITGGPAECGCSASDGSCC